MIKTYLILVATLYLLLPISYVGYKLLTYKSSDYAVYNLLISSDDAKDVTIYLPFPHYKGDPDMRIFKGLKENLKEKYLTAEQPWWYTEEAKKDWKTRRNIKLDLIDTAYGKMLYIYIPKFSTADKTLERVRLSIGKGGEESKDMERIEDPITLLEDYKLTGEDKMKPINEGPHPKSNTYILQEFNMPVYVEFKGKGINLGIEFEYCPVRTWGMFIGELFSYRFGEVCLVDNTNLYFTKSGWHWIPMKKLSVNKTLLTKMKNVINQVKNEKVND